MKIDFSKVRITGRDKDCTTMKHCAGHEIKIMHNKLSKDNRDALEAMHAKYEENKSKREAKEIAKMADGGEVFALQAPEGVKPPPPKSEKDKYGEEIGKGARKGSSRSLEDVKKTLTDPKSWWAEGGEINPAAQASWQPPILTPEQQAAMSSYMAPAPEQAPPPVVNPPVSPYAADLAKVLPPVNPQLAQQMQAEGVLPNTEGPSQVPMGMPQQQAPMGQMQQPEAIQDPTGAKAYQSQTLGGIGMQQQALKEQYKAATMQAKEQAAANVTYQGELQKAQNEFNAFNAQNQAHIDATINDIKNNAINPKAYQESMNSADKITTAIGLMAGGFGQAFVGGDNPAMTFLNKQIDRDIAAQEKNQGSRVTLLNAYQNQFHDKMAANNMTRATLNSLYASQMSLAANHAATPQAKAAMLMGAGQLQMKAAELVKSASMNEYLAKMQSSNGGSPEQQVAVMAMIDPKRAEEMRGRMIPGLGFATTNDGRKTVAETQVMVNNSKKDLGRLKQILAMPNKSINLNLRAEADTLRKSLVGSLRVPITGPGSMSEGERELLLDLVPNPTDLMSIDSNTLTRLNTLESKLNNNYKNTLEANGLKYNPIGHLQGAERQYAEWAMKNPQDTRARLVLQKLNIGQ